MPDNDLPPIDIPELRCSFLFRRRPLAIPADLRPAWRIGLLMLLLKNCCRRHRTSLARLHVLSWGFLSPDNNKQLQSALDGHVPPDSLIIRFEPFLIQAVDFAIGEGLVRRCGGSKIELTAPGETLAEELEAREGAFVMEKQCMATIRLKVSEDIVKRMFGWRNAT